MKIFRTFLLLLLFTNFIFAQGFGSIGSADARSIALGKISTVSSRGVFSLGANPANLVLSETNSIQLATVFPLPNLNVFAGNDFLSINDYNYFFSGEQNSFGETVGKYLDANDKEKFRDLFSNGTGFASDVSSLIFAFTINLSPKIGAFGFSMSDKVSAQGDIPLDLVNFFLDGNEVNRTYDLSDLDFKFWYLREYSLSYARDISRVSRKFLKQLTAGISIKLVQGFAYAGIQESNTTVKTLDDYSIKVYSNNLLNAAFSPSFGVKYDFEGDITKESSVGFFNTPAGHGLGFDLGVSGKLNNIWSFGLSITNIGSITWDKDAAEYTAGGEFLFNDLTDSTMIDSLSNAFTGEGQFVNSFSTTLPTALHFGVGMQLDKFIHGHFPGKMLILFGFNQGFNSQPSNSTNPRFSLGFEWAPFKWFPIRSGISIGGRDKFHWGFGFGLDAGIVEFNFAASDFQSIVMANDAKRIGVSLGSRWKF